jgi:hypothetical protein
MKTAYIIGKHENAAYFSGIDWKKYDSYGLNEAALLLKTKWGFTGHEHIESKYIDVGVNYICTKPTFENTQPRLSCDTIKQIPPPKCFIFENESDEILSKYIKAAITQKDIPYPNYWTILHLAIFYCLKHYDEIALIGCANKKGDLGGVGSNSSEKHQDYQRYHTDRLIELSPKKIWRCENINDLNL